MATIKYILRSSKSISHVYARIKIDQKRDYKKKTGLFVDTKNWNIKKAMPKQTTEDLKYMSSQLRKLQDYLLNEINECNNVTSDWLAFKIDVFFGRRKNDKVIYFNDYCESFLEKLQEKRGSDSVTTSTYNKYKTISNKIIKFDNKRVYRVEDVDLNYKAKFVKFLSENENLSDNTIGRYIKFLKTFLLDAKKNGLNLHNQAEQINGFTVKSEKIVLSFDEIEKLITTKFENDKLKYARDWLIISCFTGQRVSDLLRMNNKMLNEIKGFSFIGLIQQKTKAKIQIPIHEKVQSILDDYGNFPPLFSKSKNVESNSVEYNELLKKVCQIAEIDKMTLGNLRNPETKKFEKKEYEKWKLVSSHIGRRSFATNFYGKYPTPLLMNCTGHTTEKMFLEYVGKPPIDYALQLAMLWSGAKKA